jgi:hypothetical protein
MPEKPGADAIKLLDFNEGLEILYRTIEYYVIIRGKS